MTDIPTLVDGDDLTEDWTLAVEDGVEDAANPALIRRRSVRTAGSYNTGDSDWNGTLANDENVGGITGAGTTAVPWTVPEEGSYAIHFTVAGGAFAGASAVGINAGGAGITWMPIQPGTTNQTGGTAVVRLGASGQIILRVRNNSGGIVNGVTSRVEIVRVA